MLKNIFLQINVIELTSSDFVYFTFTSLIWNPARVKSTHAALVIKLLVGSAFRNCNACSVRLSKHEERKKWSQGILEAQSLHGDGDSENKTNNHEISTMGAFWIIETIVLYFASCPRLSCAITSSWREPFRTKQTCISSRFGRQWLSLRPFTPTTQRKCFTPISKSTSSTNIQ